MSPNSNLRGFGLVYQVEAAGNKLIIYPLLPAFCSSYSRLGHGIADRKRGPSNPQVQGQEAIRNLAQGEVNPDARRKPQTIMAKLVWQQVTRHGAIPSFSSW